MKQLVDRLVYTRSVGECPYRQWRMEEGEGRLEEGEGKMEEGEGRMEEGEGRREEGEGGGKGYFISITYPLLPLWLC